MNHLVASKHVVMPYCNNQAVITHAVHCLGSQGTSIRNQCCERDSEVEQGLVMACCGVGIVTCDNLDNALVTRHMHASNASSRQRGMSIR